MATIVLWRLARSERCTVVDDPKDADVFLIPLLPRPKETLEWRHSCDELKNVDIEEHLPHLTEENARRHFLLTGKGHVVLRRCDYWYRPRGLLSRVTRVAYS